MDKQDLWDLYRAGIIPSIRLYLAARRLKMPVSDMLLIARMKREIERMAVKARGDKR